ncbi:MAG: SsrA-binding protein SmpB [Acholeplasmatales bacterium]|jgi:SsrA-binding protein|nr:SsrA-binding protein SmpB [Acholeplasmatales bacterium]
MKIIVQNKVAYHNYFIIESYEAGIQLQGSEIKSVRSGKVNINDAYVTIKDGEIFIVNMHISKYEQSSIFNHVETRKRKLLLHSSQIRKLKQAKEKQGYTIIPLKMYFVVGLAKLEIALVKGKQLHDKRDDLKEKEDIKKIKQAMKRSV